MEWKLKIKEIGSGMKYVMGNDLHMIINYENDSRIEFSGTEKQLQDMGFIKIGEAVRLSMYMLIELVNIPCYKGKIVLPDGEVIDIVLCVEENGEVPILCLPYKVFDKILINVKKEEVILSADIAKLKATIENNNKRYLEEIL